MKFTIAIMERPMSLKGVGFEMEKQEEPSYYGVSGSFSLSNHC